MVPRHKGYYMLEYYLIALLIWSIIELFRAFPDNTYLANERGVLWWCGAVIGDALILVLIFFVIKIVIWIFS
jgi:hypothetical protein